MNIALAGSGNVATHLARALRDAGHKIVAVASAHAENAARLASETGAAAVETVSELPVGSCDVVIIAVSDSAVESVASELPVSDAIVAHTSGSVPLSALTARHPNAGVFYPLQTFSRTAEVDISKVPFFIEGSDARVAESLTELARQLSDNVHPADSAVRARLHIAGVLTSNFPIYLLEMAREVLGDIPLDVVEPLAYASLAKAFAHSPLKAITGPARRGDVSVIHRQAANITDALHQRIYLDLSEAILRQFHPDKII
ncbi:MAG: DUF2520 domain-containing protein [Muribaculaceae bacterium]|nr:DUF2520 domain-containing protein [Muribaculaceae bacterium]